MGNWSPRTRRSSNRGSEPQGSGQIHPHPNSWALHPVDAVVGGFRRSLLFWLLDRKGCSPSTSNTRHCHDPRCLKHTNCSKGAAPEDLVLRLAFRLSIWVPHLQLDFVHPVCARQFWEPAESRIREHPI